MALQAQWLTQADQDEWLGALAVLPRECRDVYFEPAYAALYEKAGTAAECFVAKDGESTFILPFMRNEIASRQGYFDLGTPYGYGGPLSTTDDPVFLRGAYHEFCARAVARKCIAMLLKFHPIIGNHRWAEGLFPGGLMRVRATVAVELDMDEGNRWKNIYTHANRKNIKKAVRNGCRVVFGDDVGQWNSFMKLYKETMDANAADGFYYFWAEYFDRIRTLLSKRYILASCLANDVTVSTLIVLLGETTAHCHLLGTSREWLGIGANNLLHHELILWCKEAGYEWLHIGGGRTDAADDSLLRFKLNFSDKTRDFVVGEWILNEAIYQELTEQWITAHPGCELPNRLLSYRSA